MVSGVGFHENRDFRVLVVVWDVGFHVFRDFVFVGFQGYGVSGVELRV